MFRFLAFSMTLVVAGAFALVGNPCLCVGGQAHAAEAPSESTADEAKGCCSDEQPDEDDGSCDHCDGGDCHATSDGQADRATTPDKAIANAHELDSPLPPLAPQLKATLAVWVADLLQSQAHAPASAVASVGAPAPDSSPPYLKNQVLRL